MKTYKQFIEESVAASLVKLVAKSAMQRGMLRSAAKATTKPTLTTTQRAASSITKPTRYRISTPIRGFETARGSRYTTEIKPKSFTKTQRTAAVDPSHPTPPGQKQKSDWTVFMKPDDAITAAYSRLAKGKSIGGIPMQRVPGIGLSPLEVWKKYAEKGNKSAFHPGSPITNIFRGRPGQVKLNLSPENKLDLRTRVKTALNTPRNIEILKKEILARRSKKIGDIFPSASNPTQ